MNRPNASVQLRPNGGPLSDFNPPRPPSRRQLLQAAMGLGAVSAACSVSGNSLIAPAPPNFPIGVAAGEPRSDGILVLTRYTGVKPLELRVWDGEAEATPAVFAGEVAPDESGSVKFELKGLKPATFYTYRFLENDEGVFDAGSNVGRFKTAPAATSLAPLRIGATCCTKRTFTLDVLDRASARTDLDVFLILGDTSYNDAAFSLDEYRDSWRRSLALPSHRALRAQHGLISTWDDHEFSNNWNAETIHPTRFEAGVQSFFEHMPVARNPEAPSRIWRSVKWGRTAEFFVLDGRAERRPSTRHQPDGEYISKAQMGWLKVALAESTAVFKIILNSVPITAYDGVLFQSFVDDRWEGYPAQRTEILQFIEDAKLGGVLWVAGDLHMASMGRVSMRGPGQKAIEVLVGPGGNEANPSPSYPRAPQFDWASGFNNYAVLDFDPATTTVSLKYFDGNDKVIAERSYVL
ncbi:MAG: alkaline phosphatase D family protein [Myxococcaceae bacterium]